MLVHLCFISQPSIHKLLIFLRNLKMGNTSFICCVRVPQIRQTLPGHCTGVLYCASMVSSCARLSWFQWYCRQHLENQVYAYSSYTKTTLVLDQPTLNSPAVSKYTFLRAYFMYALWIHIQGFLVVWAKRHKYCKISKSKEFYLIEGRKKVQYQNKVCMCFLAFVPSPA